MEVRRGSWVQIPLGELTKFVCHSYKLVFSYKRYDPAYKPWFWCTNFWFESTDCFKSIVLNFYNCLLYFGMHIWNFGSIFQTFQTAEALFLLGFLTKFSINIPNSGLDAHVQSKIPHWPLKSPENSTISTIVWFCIGLAWLAGACTALSCLIL